MSTYDPAAVAARILHEARTNPTSYGNPHAEEPPHHDTWDHFTGHADWGAAMDATPGGTWYRGEGLE